MNPEKMVEALRRIASDIESSDSPSREAIVAELKKLAYAVPQGESEMATFLHDAIDEWCEKTGVGYQQISSFSDIGLMTNDKGVYVQFEDGMAYELTIQESRHSP